LVFIPLAVKGDVAVGENTSYRCAWEYGTSGEGDVETVGISPMLIQNDETVASYFTDTYDGLQTSYGPGGLKKLQREPLEVDWEKSIALAGEP
jgi:hypothetical protein